MKSGNAASRSAAYADILPNFEQIIRGLLFVFIFSLPFRHLLIIERNGFIALLVLLVLWCAVERRHFFTRTPLDVPLAAFVLWVGATIPFSEIPSYSLKEYGKLLQQGLVFYAVIYFFRDAALRARLVALLVGCVAIVSVYGVGEFLFTDDLRAIQSFLPAEVWLTTYLVMFIPLCVALALFESKPRLKIVYGLIGAVAVACLLCAQSRAGLVALCCELLALAWFSKRRSMMILAGVFSLLLLLVATTAVKINTTSDRSEIAMAQAIPWRLSNAFSVFHRLEIWSFTLDRIAEHPILGIGYGKDNYRLVFGQTPEEVKPGHGPILIAGTHNIYLELALSVGVPGLLLFLWLLGRMVKVILRGVRRAPQDFNHALLLGVGVGVIGLGARLMFDHLLVASMAVQFWVLIALAMLVRRDLADAGPKGSHA